MIFNIVYIPAVFLFRGLLFGRTISDAVLIGVLAGGQIGLFIYDRAYEYVQAHMWGKLRGRMIG